MRLLISSLCLPIQQTVTVQQIQQIVKSVQQGGTIQHISTTNASPNILQHGVIQTNKQATAAGGQLQARVIPVSSTNAGGARPSQFHVVATPSGSGGTANNPTVVAALAATRQQQQVPRTVVATSTIPNVTLDSKSSSSQAVFNQVSYGQPISVAVRSPQVQQQPQKVQMVQQVGGNLKTDGTGSQQQQQQQQK
jgi:hypothetical protein